jgi:hypothetical protein
MHFAAGLAGKRSPIKSRANSAGKDLKFYGIAGGACDTACIWRQFTQ